MNSAPRRAATVRLLGTMALLAGFLVAIITLGNDAGAVEPYVLAALLVVAGVGFRIEAAVSESRTVGQQPDR
ncbi:hypothetical protein K7640_19430 [Micromonospora sp. PLK6-60]|uniref:hypothetical protein n=1 Tax=Micromonospora sp. PLK6-60 TaxID=2873383 RepID=UPI001CA64998|nr:hypothetical protein [Micromonospora sp. PLK6-60]MBY8874003.1 hypothetical protein [Micromonospora sp. PLK6-60]